MDYFEFGPFRLEVSTRSLFLVKGGLPGEFVPVTPKAFDTLCVLVEEAGRLVSKDELMRRVWPEAFVEEGSIANNISMLRKILKPYFEGDGPIATVARRGYRFTAPVSFKSQNAEISVVQSSGRHAAEVRAMVARLDAAAAAKAGTLSLPARWRVPAAVAASVLVTIGAMGVAGTIRGVPTEASSTAPARRAVAVLSMKNVSGEKGYDWFSTALSEAINTELGAGGQLRVIAGAAVAQMQQDLSPQPGVGLSRKQLDEIGRSLGCDLILTGNYVHLAGKIRVDVRLDDIATGGVVASFSIEEKQDKLVELVGAASRELRRSLGVAAPLPGQSEAARASLSSNPIALRYYFLGLEALRVHDIARSTELLTQAITEDPGFALAHSVLSISWRVLGHDDKSRVEAKRAFDLSPRLGREDQLAVQGAYYEVISDWQMAIEKYQALWNFFPDNSAYGLKLVHQQLRGGRLTDARRTLDQLRALPAPSDVDPRIDQVETDWFLRMGRLDEVAATSERWAVHARAKKSNQLLAAALMAQGRAAVRLGDFARATTALDESRSLFEKLGDRNGVGEAGRIEAIGLANRGEFAAAKSKLDAVLQLAASIRNERLQPEVLHVRSNVLRSLGRLDAAKADAEAALTMFLAAGSPSGIARALTALGEAERDKGEYQQARTHLEDAERRSRDTGEPLVFTNAAHALAELDLAEGRIDDARRRMDEIQPIDRRMGDKGVLARRQQTIASLQQRTAASR